MLAVIATGGKQYLVQPGVTIKVEKLDLKEGAAISFKPLLVEDKEVKIGTPEVTGAKVEAQVVAHGKSAKVTGVKFHNKVRYRRTFGHRQAWTSVKIEKITA